MAKPKGIYDLELHEMLNDVGGKESLTALRVAGGWIYTLWENGEAHPVFVPFDNEFERV